jgi:peptidoglycan hydrolase-like protein with peptidoglycan-binding domain
MLPIIENGSRGEWVRYCQNLLNARLFGGESIWVDGQFGIKTELAVRQFQTMKLLKIDGKVGDETWLALEAGPPMINKRPPIPPGLIETHGGGV